MERAAIVGNPILVLWYEDSTLIYAIQHEGLLEQTRRPNQLVGLKTAGCLMPWNQ